MKNYIIAPSLLSADFSKLKEEIIELEKAGADYLHLDVMDGHFVPNITFGAPIIRSLRPHTSLIFDAHLMIEKPEKYLDDFIAAGCDIITLHVESSKKIEDSLKKIKAHGKKSGLTLKPHTSVDALIPYLNLVDLILIMTVEPGFGGQEFMLDQLEKIYFLRKIIDQNHLPILLEVDGGIHDKTVSYCLEADIFVSGSFIFKNNYQQAIAILRKPYEKIKS